MTDMEEIYREYFRDVYLYILGLSGDEHMAEEVTEETFFKAITALPSFRGECDVRVWLCQIAKNEYFTHLRKSKKRANIGMEELEIREDTSKSIEELLVDSESAAVIHQKLHELPEPYKEVFHLRVFGELSFEQIGRIFGKTANWACVTYHRAKARIQKEVEALQ